MNMAVKNMFNIQLYKYKIFENTLRQCVSKDWQGHEPPRLE